MTMSPFLRDELVNHALRNAHVSLHTADPGDQGANELTGPGYVRKVAVFSGAVDGMASNTAEVEFPRMPASIFNHAGIWDAPSGGHYLWGAWLGQAYDVRAGDSFVIDPDILMVKLR